MSPCGGHGRVVCVALFSSVGALLFGLDMGYIGPILSDDSFKRDIAHLPNWQERSSEVDGFTSGLIVGTFALGCVCTSFPVCSSAFLDHLGRKVSIIVGAVVFILGAALQAIAEDTLCFLIGRFVDGCSIGIMSTVVPLYQSELAPPEMRGALASLFQVMIITGVVIAALLNQLLLPLDGGWRVAVWLQVAPAAFLLLGMLALPRSPRWLVQRGRPEDALKALKTYLPEARAKSELGEIVLGHEAEEALGKARWSEILTGRGLRLLSVGMALQLLQQLQGINAVIYFGPRIFKAVDFLDENTCQTITNLFLLAGTLPAPLLVDRCGRRALFAWSAVAQGLPSAVIGILGLTCMEQRDGQWVASSHWAGWTIIAAVFVFVFNFGYGWGPVVWVYCGEMFPLRSRSRCVGLTTMSNWVGVYIVSQFTPVLLDALGFGTFLLFALGSLMALLLALWLPETKGEVLERIDCLFDRKLGGKSAAHGSVEDDESRSNSENASSNTV